MNRGILSICLTAAQFLGIDARAQDSPRPAYQGLRFEEDWSTFEPRDAPDFFDPIKNIGLGENARLSVGGSARVRFESWDNFDFVETADDEFTLYRTFLHTDWRFGEHWRIFVEGRFSTVNNRDLPGAKRSVLDIDEGDLWNTFAEYSRSFEHVKMTVRVGRQELLYGKQRLISPLDWSNNRRIFDGILVRLERDTKWRLDAFVTSPVVIRPDGLVFNDTDDRMMFSGVYFQRPVPKAKMRVEAYALLKDHIRAAPVEDQRVTLGSHVFGNPTKRISYDFEAALQLGTREFRGDQLFLDGTARADEEIRAWMAVAEATYTFVDTPWKPAVTLGFDYASGDDDPRDDYSGTFDQLFPLSHAFLGYTDVLGRQNIIDLRGGVAVSPIPNKLQVKIDFHYLRLDENADGAFNAGGALFRPGLFKNAEGEIFKINERDVGTALDLTVSYKPDHHSSFLFGYSRFGAGDFIQATGPSENIDFVYSQWGFLF